MVLTRVNLASPAPKPRQRILLLHNGGTLGGSFTVPDIGNQQNQSTAEVRFAEGGDGHCQGGDGHWFVKDLHSFCPEIFGLADLSVHVLFEDDSSNLGVAHWQRLCDHIVTHWHDYDAFLVVHGTDTLAYLASFLSFALGDLRKPVVLTGSQRPLSELRSDARMNLVDSVQLASLGLPAVLVCFNSKVFLGSRVAKMSNLELGAFQSPNFPDLGHFGVEVTLNAMLLAQLGIQKNDADQAKPPAVDARASDKVLALSVLPGSRLPPAVRQALCSSYAGIVIEGFGLGHAPTQNEDWLLLAQEARDKGVAVLMTSQCRRGRVELSLYPIGRAFQALGVLSSLDMTRECATMKLMVMLGRAIPRAQWQSFMSQPLCRELSLPQEISGIVAGDS
jgi:L-asparaginase